MLNHKTLLEKCLRGETRLVALRRSERTARGRSLRDGSIGKIGALVMNSSKAKAVIASMAMRPFQISASRFAGESALNLAGMPKFYVRGQADAIT